MSDPAIYKYCGRHSWPLPCPDCARALIHAELMAKLETLTITLERRERMFHADGC